MLEIVDFDISLTKDATRILRHNYEAERSIVTSLPPLGETPDLQPCAQNGLGVAAFSDDKMVGYLCCVPPFSNAFRSTNATGVFSPMGANGALGEKRERVYAQMYRVAAAKWVKAGASSHSICLYSHDTPVLVQFFRYGFGMRCVDAIRHTEDIPAPPVKGYSFYELDEKHILKVLPLENALDRGFIESPFFMHRKPMDEPEFLKSYEACKSVYYVAAHERTIVAFIRAEVGGETFIKHYPGYSHVKGAYCAPEHRGKGVSRKLLSLVVNHLKGAGVTRLGVDFESLNPSAYGFWLKHFDAYTYGVVRRIDEWALRVR